LESTLHLIIEKTEGLVMSNDKSKHDLITEEEFNMRTASSSGGANPELDSPGDTEEDAGSEFDMGLNFDAGDDDDVDELDQVGSELGQVTFRKKIPESAKVVSSELPSPWADSDAPSDTH
jgi:hypothetical protein